MKILDKIAILVSLPELIRLVNSSLEQILKIFDVDLGGDL